MAEKPKLNTKLQHVDIRHHCAPNENLTIQWVPTVGAKMPADGLTKPLEPAPHRGFMRQIGLKNLKRLTYAASYLASMFPL
ncbi:hypothetical protein Egran_05811 [Elaphomyces granulatus]|uniref:Uncharacterized protein n=1 Tax=Elaphomyces granulatus TaxID=519963 RepID=A0A232LQI6_9EURO|nr:hypothetical protein Egran_05811 [Elaphomyces granulatus]